MSLSSSFFLLSSSYLSCFLFLYRCRFVPLSLPFCAFIVAVLCLYRCRFIPFRALLRAALLCGVGPSFVSRLSVPTPSLSSEGTSCARALLRAALLCSVGPLSPLGSRLSAFVSRLSALLSPLSALGFDLHRAGRFPRPGMSPTRMCLPRPLFPLRKQRAALLLLSSDKITKKSLLNQKVSDKFGCFRF